MKKTLLSIGLLVMGVTPSFASSALERALLINDFEAWLKSGSSLINWSGFRVKDVRVFNDIKQPAHIYRDFKINSIAAEEKYSSIQRLSGHISSIEKNHLGSPLLVFDIGYVDKIYVNGLTKDEVIDLRVPTKVDLLCVGFKMDYAGDISATCSMFNDPVRFTAVNNIQHPKNQENIDKILTQNLKTQISKKFNTKLIGEFEKQCLYIDSKNYDSCMELLEGK